MRIGSAVALAIRRIVQPVEEMHYAIARPWFAALGLVGKPFRFAHEGIARTVYDSIRLGAAAVESSLDSVERLDSASGARTRAIMAGLWGDSRDAHRFATPMSIRDRQGNAIPLQTAELKRAFPEAADRIVVLVHGLLETESCWSGNDRDSGIRGVLTAHPALTPITVRYNSGLPVATNGEKLATLLDQLVHRWPLPVRSIALVGHSMGGLVVRRACLAAQRAEYAWLDQVEDVVALGSPIRGTPVETLVDGLARGLAVAPQTRPLADFVNTRSQGIKDLRVGEPDNGAPAAMLGEIPSRVEPRYVAGVVTSDPAHPVAEIVGDLVVRPASSTGGGEVESSSVAIVGGLNHFVLLNDPRVTEHLMTWLNPAD
jgi:pimeloyl-ACP methyl ester carboxylesterase